MEVTASAMPDMGFGSTIEVNDITDDLGMDLLTNSKYTTPSVQVSQPSMGTPMNVGFQGGGGLEEIDVMKMDTVQPIELDFSKPSPPPSISVTRESVPTFEPANAMGPNNAFANSQSSTASGIQLTPAAMMDPAKEREQKADFINKLQRLEAKGFPVSKRFTMDNTLDEIKTEYTRLVDARQLETSMRFQRNMMMSFVTGLEWCNNKFDPFDLKLDGWSEAVHENIEDYDDIFEELYDKYKEKGKMPVEARLVFQLAGSGFMCHMTNSFFKSKMPSADDIFKKNPELAKQFAAAAATSAGPGFGNFMGMAMGVPPPTMAPQPQQQPQQQQQPMGVPLNMASGPAQIQSPGAFFNSPQFPNSPQQFASQPPTRVARREMSGPTGVDDILKTFEEVRAAQEQEQMNIPMMPPSLSPTRAAAAELQSVGSDDLGSVFTEKTSGGTRRRARKQPVGNVVSLDV